MSEFAPPSGPPPPHVPEGWKAVWNQQYNEWFYVNLHTKESTWEKPTAPAPHPGEDVPPPGGPPPPSYAAGANDPHVSDTKKPLESNNPFNQHGGGPGHETDEEMARRLQREEEASRGNTYPSHSPNPAAMAAGGGGYQTGDRGASDSYYQNATSPQPGYQNTYPSGPQNTSQFSPTSSAKRGSGGGGLFGKLKDKFGAPGGSSGFPPRPAGYGQSAGGYMPQQHGGYPQQQYGGYPQQGYGGYPQQAYMQQAQKKKHGMGAGGAAALGVGGGLLGGMLLADAIDDHEDAAYEQGFDDGAGDFGGGDF